MSDPVAIIFSVPTSGGGATAAATYSFYSSNYRSPRQGRSLAIDRVHNQNGITTHRYDNGPNIRTWPPFDLMLVQPEAFQLVLPEPATQMNDLNSLWNYLEGPMGMESPDGVFSVTWSPDFALEPQMVRYPGAAGDKIEYRVQVALEEA